MGMSLYGLYLWRSRSGEDKAEELSISQMTVKDHWVTLFIGGVIGVGVAYVTGLFYDASWPYLDSLTTAFLMLATYYLVKRKIECWIYFMITDAVYIYIYWLQGAKLFAGMMVVYTIMAAVGYWQWRKEMETEMRY